MNINEIQQTAKRNNVRAFFKTMYKSCMEAIASIDDCATTALFESTSCDSTDLPHYINFYNCQNSNIYISNCYGEGNVVTNISHSLKGFMVSIATSVEKNPTVLFIASIEVSAINASDAKFFKNLISESYLKVIFGDCLTSCNCSEDDEFYEIEFTVFEKWFLG